MENHLNNLERDRNGNGNGNVYLERLRYPTNQFVISISPWQVQELVSILVQQMQNDNHPSLHQVLQIINNNNQPLQGNVVPNLERDREGNGNGNVFLERLRYPTNQFVISISPWQVQELVPILVQQMQNDNHPLLHQVMQIINNNNQPLLGNVVPNEIGQIPQLDPDRANPEDGINNLLGLYAGAQGAIFNSSFFVEGRTGCEIVWTPLILSGLVSVATIVSVLKIFFQQFRRLPQENYWSWVAQKAAVIVMLMAFSVCLLLSCTSVLCISRR